MKGRGRTGSRLQVSGRKDGFQRSENKKYEAGNSEDMDKHFSSLGNF
jgi:hypothetical protein